MLKKTFQTRILFASEFQKWKFWRLRCDYLTSVRYNKLLRINGPLQGTKIRKYNHYGCKSS